MNRLPLFVVTTLFVTGITGCAGIRAQRNPAQSPSCETIDRLWTSVGKDAKLLYENSLGRISRSELPAELQTRFQGTQHESTTKKRHEIGGVLVHALNNEISLKALVEGNANGISISDGGFAPEVIAGQWHTHPWEYEQLKNMPFSPRDITNIYQYRNGETIRKGYVHLILSGEHSYSIEIIDPERAKQHFVEQEMLARADGKTIFDYLYKKFYSVNRGENMQEIQINSGKHILGGLSQTGMAYCIKRGDDTTGVLLNP